MPSPRGPARIPGERAAGHRQPGCCARDGQNREQYPVSPCRRPSPPPGEGRGRNAARALATTRRFQPLPLGRLVCWLQTGRFSGSGFVLARSLPALADSGRDRVRPPLQLRGSEGFAPSSRTCLGRKTSSVRAAPVSIPRAGVGAEAVRERHEPRATGERETEHIARLIVGEVPPLDACLPSCPRERQLTAGSEQEAARDEEARIVGSGEVVAGREGDVEGVTR